MRRKQRFGERTLGMADRRASYRFPLRLPVRYRTLGQGAPSPWVATESVNISSSGIFFRTLEAVAPGQALEASVAWPVFLDKHIPLRLSAKGLVVRSVDGGAAMHFETYEFRTCQIASDAPIGLGVRTEAGLTIDSDLKIAG